jgi:Mrp family chromosome partitioning ATPase
MGKIEKAEPTSDGSGVTVAADPVLLVGLGRGRVGKSTVLRFAIERARNAGRDVIVADGDMRNPTLSGVFPDARRPHSADATGRWRNLGAIWR